MKNRQAIILLFIANSISGFAQGISMIAIPWYLTSVLGQGEFHNSVYLLAAFLSLFWGPFSGTLVDRYNRKTIFLINSLVGGGMLFIVAGVGFYLGELPAVLVGLVFVSTFLIYNIHYPNLYAFVQEISDPKDYGRITSYIEIQGQLTTAIAGAFAAILLEGTSNGKLILFGYEANVGFDLTPWSIHEIFLLDGTTYAAAFMLIALIRFKPVAVRHPEVGDVFSRMRTGFNYLLNNRLILIFGLASYSIFVTVLIVNFTNVMPNYVNHHLGKGAGAMASMELYFAIGSLLAGIFIRSIFRATLTVRAIILLSFTVVIVYAAFYTNTNMKLFYFGAALIGFSNAGTRVLRVSYLLSHIPNQVMGRSNSIFFVANVLARLGITVLLYSAFLNEMNVANAFLLFSGFVLLGGLVLIIYQRQLTNLPKPDSPGVLGPSDNDPAKHLITKQ